MCSTIGVTAIPFAASLVMSSGVNGRPALGISSLARLRTRIRLQGDPPSPLNPPPGCVFSPRCWKATDVCGTVAPQLVVRRVFETPHRYEELRNRFAAEWRAGPDAWSPEARRIFAELGLDEHPTARRSLAESPTFRALLEEPLAAAA